MNKKAFGLLLLFPLTASCSGMPTSKEAALNILDNIEKNVEKVCETSYTQTTITTVNEIETKIVNIYSRENKFFHTYTISTQSSGRISESWKFVKAYERVTENGVVSEDYIFDIVRIISESSLNKEQDKQYVVTYEKYSDSGWDKAAKDFEGRISKRFLDAIEHSRALLNDDTKQVSLNSWNDISLKLDSKEEVEGQTRQATQYQLDVYNNMLISIKTSSGENNETENSFVYSTGDIIYPNFKITINN